MKKILILFLLISVSIPVLCDPVLNESNVIKHFSGGLKFRTISNLNYKLSAFDEFEKFINYLQVTYPLTFKKTEFTKINQYVLLFKLNGKDKSKLPILLTAHYDVVPPGNELNWEQPPFSGYFDGKYFYSRGTLDDKASVFAIMEALTRLLSYNFVPERDIYIAFSHDEETGNDNGAPKVVQYFQENNIRFDHVLDEGGRMIPAQENYQALIGISEKGRLLTRITISTQGGHASTPPKNTAVEMLAVLIQKISYKQDYKNAQDYAKKHTTMAVTMIEASNASNVISKDASMIVDSRIIPSESCDDVKKRIEKIVYSTIKQKDNVKIEYISETEPTAQSDVTSTSYKKLEKLITDLFPNTTVAPMLVLRATDARTYGLAANNTYRFLPATLLPEDSALMHSDNEKISLDNYLKMILFYENYMKMY